MNATLRDEKGRPLSLGQKLGEGGEGVVHKLATDARLAVKVYTKGMSPDRMRKIQILSHMENANLDRYAARPRSLAYDAKGNPCGLVLPVVDRGADIHNLYNLGSRRTSFPTATWRFILHVCANVARAFAAVHQLGLVIGDVNPGSILVLADGTIRLIDVDSFQVPVKGSRPLLCTVAVQMFLPPELHGASLDKTIRSTNHDSFGLAVMLFHLLALGRHPYAGRFLGQGEMPVEKAIAENRFVYGARAAQLQMDKPPNSVGLEILSPRLAALFEAAFADPRKGQGRPSAVQWVDALTALQNELKQCTKAITHQYFQGLSACPWCKLEAAVSLPLFGQPGTTATTGAAKGSGIESEYRRLSDFFTALPAFMPPSPPPRAGMSAVSAQSLATNTKTWSEWPAVLSGALSILGGLIMANGWGVVFSLLGLGFVIWGLGAPSRRRHPLVQEHRTAAREHAKLLREFEKVTQRPRSMKIREQAANLQASWQKLPAWRDQEIQRLESQKRAAQLKKFLESRLLEQASIKGIGASRLAMLSSYNINTAWDVNQQALLRIPTFGPVLADRVVAWRQEQERAFVFRPNAPLPQAVLSDINQKLDKKRLAIVGELRIAVHDYKSAQAEEALELKQLTLRLKAAETALQHAESNLFAVTGKKSP